MSQVFTQTLSLQQLVEGVDAVIVARSCNPTFRVEKVPLEGKDAAGNPWEPFERVWHEVEVDEVLSGEGLKPQVRLSILGQDDARRKGIHEEYVREGVSKSPIFFSYPAGDEAEIDWQAHAPVLVFLARRDDGWEMAGYASLSEKDRVKQLLSEKPGTKPIPRFRRE